LASDRILHHIARCAILKPERTFAHIVEAKKQLVASEDRSNLDVWVHAKCNALSPPGGDPVKFSKGKFVVLCPAMDNLESELKSHDDALVSSGSYSLPRTKSSEGLSRAMSEPQIPPPQTGKGVPRIIFKVLRVQQVQDMSGECRNCGMHAAPPPDYERQTTLMDDDDSPPQTPALEDHRPALVEVHWGSTPSNRAWKLSLEFIQMVEGDELVPPSRLDRQRSGQICEHWVDQLIKAVPLGQAVVVLPCLEAPNHLARWHTLRCMAKKRFALRNKDKSEDIAALAKVTISFPTGGGTVSRGPTPATSNLATRQPSFDDDQCDDH